MLILKDEEIAGLLTMEDCIASMETALRGFGDGEAPNPPRLRYACASDAVDSWYYMNLHSGAVPALGVSAVRIDSNLARERAESGQRRVDFRKDVPRHHGLVLLYSLETSELLAMLQEFSLSGIRVAATTAVALKRIARVDSETLGLFGTGRHARLHLQAAASLFPLRQVVVYSTNEAHRVEFAQEMGALLNIDVVPASSPKEVVQGAAIVCCATNSSGPVFDGAWLELGQTVTTIVNSDVVMARSEVDETTIGRADSIVIHDMDSVRANNQRELLDPIERGLASWDDVRQLDAIVRGVAPGRQSDEELIYYKANTGMAIQFAAAGAAAYRKAIEQGVGTQLPADWFFTDLGGWYDKGYYPGG